MFFDNIIGHRDTLSNFEKWLLNGSFEGVYLFKGQKGIGKRTVAYSLSRYLCCTGVKDSTCRCENCRLFPNIPDFFEINDSQSSIKVSDIAGVENFLSLVPFRSNKRVVLIDDFDRATHQSYNKILKILEDIKSHAFIILISSLPEKIPDVVTSRAKVQEFKQLSSDEYIHILKGLGYKSSKFDDIKRAIPYLSGSILCNFTKYVDYFKKVPNFIKKFPDISEDDWLIDINEIDSSDGTLFFIESLIIYMNDLLKIHYDSPDVVTNISILDQIEATSLIWKDEFCFVLMSKLQEIIKDYNRNLNIKLRPRLISALAWTHTVITKEKNK